MVALSNYLKRKFCFLSKYELLLVNQYRDSEVMSETNAFQFIENYFSLLKCISVYLVYFRLCFCILK